jgi:hypothetical protein
MAGIGMSLFTGGLPNIVLGNYSRPINRVTREGESIVPFTYFYPNYVMTTAPGQSDAVFQQDPRTVRSAELISVLITMPTSTMPANTEPQADTVFKLFTTSAQLLFTFPASSRVVEFKNPGHAGLPWRWWEGPVNDTFVPLKLAVHSAGVLPTRPHQRVQITAMIRLMLRDLS